MKNKILSALKNKMTRNLLWKLVVFAVVCYITYGNIGFLTKLGLNVDYVKIAANLISTFIV